QAPAVFIVHNNFFAISFSVKKQTAAKTFANKTVTSGMEGYQVHGMHVIAVYRETKHACENSINGDEPSLIETLTYRYEPHTMAGDDPTSYRSDDLDSE